GGQSRPDEGEDGGGDHREQCGGCGEDEQQAEVDRAHEHGRRNEPSAAAGQIPPGLGQARPAGAEGGAGAGGDEAREQVGEPEAEQAESHRTQLGEHEEAGERIVIAAEVVEEGQELHEYEGSDGGQQQAPEREHDQRGADAQTGDESQQTEPGVEGLDERQGALGQQTARWRRAPPAWPRGSGAHLPPTRVPVDLGGPCVRLCHHRPILPCFACSCRAERTWCRLLRHPADRVGVSRTAEQANIRDNGSMNARILVVDDDTALAEMIGIVLKSEGFEPFFCATGDQAFEEFQKVGPDLVLLDLMLPGKDGLEVCREIREVSSVPIIMLTAKSDTVDVVLGLESGADDYVPKPFKPKELIARVRARLRLSAPQAPELLTVGDVVVDVAGHTVTKGGSPVSLTPLEFDLLVALARKPWQVFSRETLLEEVWGYRHAADTRLVNVHVQRLRSKIERDPEKPDIIVTVRGVGYKAGRAA